MPTLRFKAIGETLNRKPVIIEEPGRRSEIFSSNVFNEGVMRQFLTKEAYENVIEAIRTGKKNRS